MTKLSDEAVEKLLSNSTRESDADVSITLEEIEAQGGNESLRRQFESIASYKKMLDEKITFINEHLTYAIPFTRENLYLVCAYTGSGKSTMAANISYPLWQQQKKVLVISNEESEADVIYRIACLHLGLNFNDYKKGTMPVAQTGQVMALFKPIQQFVKVIDVDYKDGLTARLEGVQNCLKAVQDDPNNEYSCVLIDYMQNINESKEDKTASKFAILDKFKTFLVRYIKASHVPVVLFAQLHSIGKRNNPDLDSRIKDYPAISEAATVMIEAIPDFEMKTTDFRIAKDRFGYQGKRIQCGFDHGRFVHINDEWLAKQRAMQVSQVEEKLSDTVFGENGQVSQISNKEDQDDNTNVDQEVSDMQKEE